MKLKFFLYLWLDHLLQKLLIITQNNRPLPIEYKHLATHTQWEMLHEYRYQLVYTENGHLKKTLGEIERTPGTSFELMKSTFEVIVSALLKKEQWTIENFENVNLLLLWYL